MRKRARIGGRWLVTVALAFGLVVVAATACEPDTDGDPQICVDGCAKAAEICRQDGVHWGDESTQDCLKDCGDATEAERTAAMSCLEAATSCNDADACRL